MSDAVEQAPRPASAQARWLGRRDYSPVWQAMRRFTDERDAEVTDQLWALEHNPVFTQGQRGSADHVLATNNIPIVETDRGGQVTYHGPGQLVVYPLLNIRRLNLGPRKLVMALEQAMIDCLASYDVVAIANREAPGVYVDGRKIGSIGMRIRRGCCYHGLSLNVDMDLAPFSYINPCGYAGLQMTQLSELTTEQNIAKVLARLLPYLAERLGLSLGELDSDNQALP